MANQFITGQGQGFDPDEDQRKRTLASGVNQGQGLPNMDPGKVGNPYGPQNPYGEAPTARAQKPAAAPAGGGGNPYQAPATQPAAGGAGAAPAQPSVTQRQALAQAPLPQAQGGAPNAPNLTVSPTGTYQQNFDAAGEGLRRAAMGQQTGDQMAAERIAADKTYYEGANQAAEQGAARGLGSSSGFQERQQIALAGQVGAATVQSRAADTAQARDAYLEWQQQATMADQAEQDRQQRSYEALLETTRFNQEQQNKLAEAERQREQQEYLKWLELGGGALTTAAGAFGGPAAGVAANVLGNRVKGAFGG